MNINKIKEKLEYMLTTKRYNHSISVAECAVEISHIYNQDEQEAYLAGLVHDCAKNLNKEQVFSYVDKYNIELDQFEINNINLSHSTLGTYIAKYEFEIDNEDVLNSINSHTTGRANMSLLEKIIYMADLIEKNRSFPGVEELRELVYNNKLDDALLKSLNNTIKIVIDRNQVIHPKTIEARNYLIQNVSKL